MLKVFSERNEWVPEAKPGAPSSNSESWSLDPDWEYGQKTYWHHQVQWKKKTCE